MRPRSPCTRRCSTQAISAVAGVVAMFHVLRAPRKAHSGRMGVVTDAPDRPALRDAGGAVVWLMALPLRWITDEPEKPWPARPDDAESLHWVNYVRAWAWGMLTACWTVPWLVVVN